MLVLSMLVLGRAPLVLMYYQYSTAQPLCQHFGLAESYRNPLKAFEFHNVNIKISPYEMACLSFDASKCVADKLRRYGGIELVQCWLIPWPLA